jgi:hypothetical protein
VQQRCHRAPSGATHAEIGQRTPSANRQRAASERGDPITAAIPRSKCATALDGSLIARIHAYIDTLELTFRRRPKGLLAEARKILGRKIWPEPIISPDGRQRGVRYIIHQPTPELLRALDKYGGIVSRVDIAFDIFPLHLSLEEMAALIRSNTLLRWRALGRMHDYKTTLYWVEEYKGGARPDRNLAEYHDEPSKLNGRPVVHLELRLQTSDATKAENLYLPSDLEKLNPRELFDKHLSVIDFQRHIQRDTLDSNHKTRTRGFYKRFYQNRVQVLQDSQPRIVKRLKALNSRFRINDRLTWGASAGAKDHLTWKQRDARNAITEKIE